MNLYRDRIKELNTSELIEELWLQVWTSLYHRIDGVLMPPATEAMGKLATLGVELKFRGEDWAWVITRAGKIAEFDREQADKRRRWLEQEKVARKFLLTILSILVPCIAGVVAVRIWYPEWLGF